jgi:ribonuclease P protein component
VLDIPPPFKIERLKKRWQFLSVARGRSVARGAVVVQVQPREENPSPGLIGVGFTATRKIGGAVERNRAKRRMREAARALLPLHGQGGCDYVLVARSGAVTRPWARLLDDVESALISLAAGGDDPKSAPRPARKPRTSAPSRQA